MKGLLKLFREPLLPSHFCRVFNAFKNVEQDRQIGDRRIPNARERSIDGPSAYLPPGFLLCNMRVLPYRQQLFASITDRRDFYHQAKVSPARAHTNLLPFCFSEEELGSCEALSIARQEELAGQKRRRPREVAGDGFGGAAFSAGSSNGWYAGFNSLFQGDHLGVEFALQAHETLLTSGSLLDAESRVLGRSIFPAGDRFEGLIIDDYFAIGKEDVGALPSSTFAAWALAEARRLYQAHGLPGSPEKDVEAENEFKAAGAEVVSTKQAVGLGLTTVGAPLSKRLGLAQLSLRAAKLGSTSSSLISRLAGNWTSILMYRRCLMAIVDDLFALAARAEKEHQNEVLFQPVSVRNELILLSDLAPLMCSNIAVDYCPYVFASDASLGKDAVTFTAIDPKISEAIWLGSDKRGTYSKLQAFPQSLLAAVGEELQEDLCEDPWGECRSVEKPLALSFDFVEFYGGSGRVTAAAAELGLVVAPPLDLDSSDHYDLSSPRLLEWCLYMIEAGRFGSFLTEPPCTTFSAAAYPALRSYAEPLGFCPSEPRTKHGNLLAFRSFVLLRHGRRFSRPCGKEQPRSSKMRRLGAWSSLLELGFEESIVASCQYGSPHKKEFVFLTFLIDSKTLEHRCPGGHQHVKIQGQ